MPPLTRLFIKSAFLYFVASLLVGALLLLNGTAPLGLSRWVAALRPTYYHLLIVGWATQLIFGVIFWMFPKITREEPRGNERLAWFSFAALNAGLLLRLLTEPWQALTPNPLAAWGLGASALLQLAAGWAFIWVSWPRVKGK
ncbi:MAG: hypothetical protein M3220_18910 [Chloroflexota bacterium]|nr:hypothetical protein [Chloroflexota bacterium]